MKKKYWATRVIMITKQDNNSKYKKLQADITNSNSLLTEKNGCYFKTKCLGKYLVPRQKNQKNYENCKRKSFTLLSITTFTAIQLKRLRELMHTENTKENCMQNFCWKTS
jgi:hypothetical protein